MNISISIHDFNIICRICLQNQNDMSVLLTSEINYMIATCTSVQENYIDNKMPQQICNECYEQLNNAYQFKQKYIQSTQILTEIIVKTEVQTDNEEIDEKIFKNDVKTENNCEFETTDKQEFKLCVNENENNEKSEENDNFDDSKIQLNSNIEIYLNEEVKSCVEMKKRPHVKKNKKIKRNLLSSNEHTCDICSKTFKTRKQLRIHKISHSAERPYKCTACPGTFKYKWSLKKHTDLAHNNPDRREICFICGKGVMPNSYRYHLSSHETRNTDEKYKCDICERLYKSEDVLRRHFLEKHKDSVKIPLHCDICNKGFISKGSLRIHKTYTHSTEKKFKCQYCDKSYKMVSPLNRHVDNVHKNLRPHVCSTCNKAFHSKRNLRKHLVCHTGERPYTCETCGKSFGTKSVLYTHRKVHSK